MKLPIIILSLTLIGCATQSKETSVTIENKTANAFFFQPEGSLGYNKINATDTTIILDVARPAYYSILGGNNHRVAYIEPGTSSHIAITDSGINVTGDLLAENEFIKANIYLCRTPDSIKTYSKEWARYHSAEMERLATLLDNSHLSDEFTTSQKLYYNNIFLNQRLTGPERDAMFQTPGQPVQLDDDYYDFLDKLEFDNPALLSVPNWFNIVNRSLEEMERHGYLPADNDNYMSIYAKRISNDEVKSQYLVKLLDLTLKKGYTNDIAGQLNDIRQLILPADTASLSEITDSCSSFSTLTAAIARGQQIPDFTANTIDGKEYSISDFKGKVTVIDFWYTGCVPCKAEVPFYEALAKEMDGKDVQFLSVSLDTGDELMAEWRRVMKAKPADSKVLSLNLPGGFNSDLLPKLHITGVPRIMLIDKEGKIVDAYAKRPSDPKLKAQINKMLK